MLSTNDHQVNGGEPRQPRRPRYAGPRKCAKSETTAVRGTSKEHSSSLSLANGQSEPPKAETAALALRLKINCQWRSVDPAELLDDVFATTLREACATAEGPVLICLDYLLDFTDKVRWTVLDFIADLGTYRLSIGNDQHADLFEAVLSLMVDVADLKRCGNGKMAAIEAAILLFPEALEAACDRISQRLKELKVKGVRHSDLLRDARRMLKDLHKRAGLVEEQAELLRIREILPDAPVADTIQVPVGWRLSADGFDSLSGDGPGVTAPVVIVERGRDAHRDVEMVTLAWHRDSKWHLRVVDRRDIADHRSIINLAAMGLPVTSINARTLVQYLHEFEALNLEHLPATRVSHKLGWQGEAKLESFLWGRELITADGIAETGPAVQPGSGHFARFRGVDDGDDQLADGFRKSGTFEKWVEAFRLLQHCPRALLGLYAAFVPPLLPIFQSPNFVLDFAGPTTSGKTTLLRAVASAWGRPKEDEVGGAMSTWNSTATYRERAPAVCCHMPFILDDTKHVRYPDEVAKTIYSVVQGGGRGRGTVKGIAHRDSCVTVLFSSGEQPATSFTRDGGTRPRVLSFWGSPFGEINEQGRERARQLDRLIRENYGHAGPRFVQHVLGQREHWGEWRHLYEGWVAYYEKLAGEDAIAGRMAVHFAALALGSSVAHIAVNLPWEWEDPVRPVWKELTSSTSEADTATSALRLAIDWAVAHRRDFFPPKAQDSRQPYGGWVGRWDVDSRDAFSDENTSSRWPWIGFFPQVLEAVLTEAKYDFDAVIRTWKDNGWLECDADGSRNTKRVQIDKELARVIAIKREAVETIH
jgi:putative DNA primase/helicase